MTRDDALGLARAVPVRDREARQGGWPGPGGGDRGGAAGVSVEQPGRSGRHRRRRPRGPGDSRRRDRARPRHRRCSSRRRSAAAPSWRARCCTCPMPPDWESSWTRTRSQPAPDRRSTGLGSRDSGPHEPQHRLRLGARRRTRAGRGAARLRLARVALRAARAGALEGAGHPGVDPRGRALLRASSRSGSRSRPGSPPRADDVGHRPANLHPAVAEASEARAPLIVITADRPPELRDRGAGQTIDQLKLYGSAVRWFCEVGVQPAPTTGTPARPLGGRARRRGIAGRASRPGASERRAHGAAGARPGRGRRARESRRWRSTADPASGRSRRSRGPPSVPTRRAGRRVRRADHRRPARRDPRRPPARPGDRGAPSRRFSDACGYPVLPEPTSQLRAGTHGLRAWSRTTTRSSATCPTRLAPELVVRVGDMVTSKAVRMWLAAHRECRQVVIDPDGRLERADRRPPT